MLGKFIVTPCMVKCVKLRNFGRTVKNAYNRLGIALIIVFWLLVIGLRIDDPLSEDVKQFLADMPSAQSNPAFEYAYGFDAPLGQDPAKQGRVWLDEYRATKRAPAKDGALEDVLEKHCITNYMRCFIDTFYHLDVGELDDEVRNTLIIRYQNFWQKGPYVPVIIDGVISQPAIPNVFFEAHRLNLVSELQSMYNDKDLLVDQYISVTKPIIEAIYSDTANLRGLLRDVDNYHSRLRIMMAISDNLNALALLQIIFHDLPLLPIEPLTTSERSMRLAAQKEVFEVLQFNLEFAESSERATTEKEAKNKAFGSVFTAMIYPYVIKKHMWANFIYADIHSAVVRSEMNPVDYFPLAKSSQAEMPFFDRLRGGIIPKTGLNYDKNIARGFMLDQKITLFNTLIVSNTRQALGEVVNPLYGRKGSAYLEEQDGKACLPQPIEDKLSMGCVAVKIFRER